MVIIKIGLTFSGFATVFKFSADSAPPHCPGQTDCLHRLTIATVPREVAWSGFCVLATLVPAKWYFMWFEFAFS